MKIREVCQDRNRRSPFASRPTTDPMVVSVTMVGTPEVTRRVVGWIASSDEGDGVEPWLWGLTPEAHLDRSLRRGGCQRVVRGEAPPALLPGETLLAVRPGFVLDERLPRALATRPDTSLVDDRLGPIAVHARADRVAEALDFLRGKPAAAFAETTPTSLVPAYQPKLRKRAVPFVLPADPAHQEEIERLTFSASYKGSSDLVTLWVWPRPALAATRTCARRRIHPNTVTAWSWVAALVTTLLFVEGAFVAGLLCGWGMTFLDTVDGKLARVTLTSSRFGDVFDHGLDLLHPPFWWWAFGAALGTGFEGWTSVIVGGYVAGRLLEGAFLASFGFECHCWRPVDALFRTITARRNPNLLLLSVGTAVGRPDLGFVVVGLWTVGSLAFHTLRLAQAWRARLRGEPVVAASTG